MAMTSTISSSLTRRRAASPLRSWAGDRPLTRANCAASRSFLLERGLCYVHQPSPWTGAPCLHRQSRALHGLNKPGRSSFRSSDVLMK